MKIGIKAIKIQNTHGRYKMQTFLPIPDFQETARALDYRRLGKQRVEAMQILKALRGESLGWRNHPAVKMWRGFEEALETYQFVMIEEWKRRGYRNTMIARNFKDYQLPPWFGREDFHIAHKSNLLVKNYEYYVKHFGNEIPLDLPYVWS